MQTEPLDEQLQIGGNMVKSLKKFESLSGTISGTISILSGVSFHAVCPGTRS